MDAQNTPADRIRHPRDFQQLALSDGRLLVHLRNDMDRDEAIRTLRQIADRLELVRERELTAQC